MEVGQDLIGDGKAGFCPGPLPDNIPVAVVQAEERLQVIAELGVLFHGEKEPVYQEYDGHGRAQVEKTQGNGDGAVHGHGSHGEGIAGGEDGLIPCAGLCAVHEGDHDQSKHDLASDSRKQGLDEEFYAATQESSDGTGLQPVAAVLIAGLQQDKGIQGNPVGAGIGQQEA